jgi:fucose permease
VRTPRRTLLVAWLSIFVIGMLSGAVGPLLPILAARLALPVEALGALYPALFAGALTAQLVGGWVAERIGLRNLVVLGTGLLTFGILGLTGSPTLPLLLAAASLAGLGQGAIDVSSNVLIAAVFPRERVVSAVNLLHVAFGAGAMLAPVIATAAAARLGSPMPALHLAGALGIATMLLGARMLLDAPAAHGSGGPGATGLYRSPALWLLALIMFLYVGGEMGVGGWTARYLERTSDLGAGPIALVVSAYWAALTGGRLAGAVLGARLSASTLLLWSVSGSLLGAAMVLLGGGGVAATVAGTLVLGVAYGPIFPTAVVLATERFPAAAGRAVSVLVSVSSVGGMALPPLQGVLLERVSPLASVALVAAGAAGMLGARLLVQAGGPTRGA